MSDPAGDPRGDQPADDDPRSRMAKEIARLAVALGRGARGVGGESRLAELRRRFDAALPLLADLAQRARLAAEDPGTAPELRSAIFLNVLREWRSLVGDDLEDALKEFD